jgi:hypothetical protein
MYLVYSDINIFSLSKKFFSTGNQPLQIGQPAGCGWLDAFIFFFNYHKNCFISSLYIMWTQTHEHCYRFTNVIITCSLPSPGHQPSLRGFSPTRHRQLMLAAPQVACSPAALTAVNGGVLPPVKTKDLIVFSLISLGSCMQNRRAGFSFLVFWRPFM